MTNLNLLRHEIFFLKKIFAPLITMKIKQGFAYFHCKFISQYLLQA